MITRLKEEAHQSRREMQDWKEQYLRVEQERSRLLERIDGLVTQNAGVRRNLSALLLILSPDPMC